VVSQVHRRDEIFQGDQLPRLPDLIVHTDRRRYVSFGHADFGSNRLLEQGLGQTGHHTMTGVLAMCGPGIRQGVALQEAHILDLAPTILHLLREPVPPYMDGTVLRPALEADLADAAAHGIGEPEGTSAGPPSDYSPADEEAVRKRLEDLGYLG